MEQFFFIEISFQENKIAQISKQIQNFKKNYHLFQIHIIRIINIIIIFIVVLTVNNN